MICARLSQGYDEDLLRRDLDNLRGLPRAPQAGPYHDGEWTGLTLYEQGGDLPDEPYPWLRHYGPTHALARAPYLAEVLSSVDCPKLLVRLLTLPPDAEIGVHSDAGSNFQFGSVRLHVPIVTHEDVIMVIDGERVHWRPGELWWGDFSRPHWLRNDSSVTRVHLVIDVQPNDFLLDLFPAELLAAQRSVGTGISTYRAPLPPARRTDAELAAFRCQFALPSALTPLFGHGAGLRELTRDGDAVCEPADGVLVVSLGGRPAFALERVGERVFTVIGQPAGVFAEFDDARRPTVVEFVVRGVPEDLYAAQLGVQSGPVIPEQRFPAALEPARSLTT